MAEATKGNLNILKLRKNVERCLGQHVQLKANRGRKKAVIWEGILENTYACIFTVRLASTVESPEERRATFSYTDLLMKTIEFSVVIGNKRYHLS
ncbi:MAG TPA: Veg protein [Clostridiales bacterium]|nr:Veg protein [Clostridiales bacterium]